MAKTVDECLREFNFCLTKPNQITRLQVELWADCGFKGTKTTVTTGDFPIVADLGIPDNKLSSFKVPRGLTLTVYRNGNFGGDSKVFTGPVDVSCLKNVCLPGSSRAQDGSCNLSWNDRISSLKVRKTTTAPPAARLTTAPAPAARLAAAPAPAAPSQKQRLLQSGQAILTAETDISNSPPPFPTPRHSQAVTYTMTMDVNIAQAGPSWRNIFNSGDPDYGTITTRRPAVFITGNDVAPANRIHIVHGTTQDNNRNIVSTFVAQPGTYFNLTWVVQNGTLTTYINGRPDPSGSVQGGFSWGPDAWKWNAYLTQIPNRPENKAGPVKIKNAYWFDRALSATDIATLADGASAAAAPVALRTFAAPPTATWVKPGYKLAYTSSVPNQFRLKNATTGQYITMDASKNIIEAAGTGTVLSKSTPPDIFKNAATAGITMMTINTPGGVIGHGNFVLYGDVPYAPVKEQSWKFLLKDGTTDRIIIWNPYPLDANGMYLTGGPRPKIDPGTPTEYIIEPATAGSGTSGYALEGSPFGGPIVRGRNWVLILTLLLVVILLWIIEKNM